MGDPFSIALRFALYTDLMVLFGLALFGLYSLRGPERQSGAVLNFRSLLTGTAVLGALLSLASLVQMTRAMSGATEWEELFPHLKMMVAETEVGLSWNVRVTALVTAAVAGLLTRRSPKGSLWVVTALSGLALATLAWTGHGAMDEGSRRFWHFASDILHLLAAGGWVGALVAFALLLRPKKMDNLSSVKILARTLTGFESAGGVIVATILVTGVVNYLFIVGPQLNSLVDTPYGWLLMAKLALFAAMMGLASLNRFRLSPRLEHSLVHGDYSGAARALRWSMATELAAAVTVLGLIAWLGTLSPEVEMAMH
ncbi:copper homeostasis membrane protein CopD [Pseudomonas alliivorans]|uniref:Copper resistance protein D n=1 Tax=Pseudomonas cannabina pv. alisalensis TaxID=757414 RepID=A0ABS1X7W6_PSEC1|nr:copper homeostasis membrane protein CopD [Pseudomonas cannabina]MEE4964494.1 copper homeostasis membrane protein CopD [Pseudomonas alliivorans]MBM0137554.1 copper homeostasis membrane protein CopD [Pseudomonas cannabina pv. alisalensis]MEE4974577.1 copper homeostasis membrane protein CopD [Pseudomonas alliivorans]MEE4979726.1 copper homeostasis membrane protein CopD [Pseudomonas alliivorans]MEE4984821.1 copper homeostasis membrane protein CopD [Pseudomonas alliivorans]